MVISSRDVLSQNEHMIIDVNSLRENLAVLAGVNRVWFRLGALPTTKDEPDLPAA